MALTVATIVGHLSLFAVLLITLRAMGVSDDEVGWAQVLATFAFARLLTAIPLTPGGVGIIELALISGITRAGGEDAAVVASVLIFRLLTYVVPIIFGAITYVYWRRNRSWLDSAPPLPASIAAGCRSAEPVASAAALTTTRAPTGQVVPSRATAATTRSRSTLPMNRPP